MKRQETIAVWNPSLTDDVFQLDTEGVSWESIGTTTDGDSIGARPTGDAVSIEYSFPNAEMTAAELINALLNHDRFESGRGVIEHTYTVYDSEHESVFTIGPETDTKIVVHTKQPTTSSSLKALYTDIETTLNSPIQVIKYKHEYPS